MSKKKQTYNPCDDCLYSYSKNNQESRMCKICEFTYFKDHRQSEWISVEDRLPKLEDGRNWGNHRPRSIRVLCVCHQRSGKIFVKEGYYELFNNKPCWRIPGSIDDVTHWMPLPEAPKGGEE